jgi:hypothetical protein
MTHYLEQQNLQNYTSSSYIVTTALWYTYKASKLYTWKNLILFIWDFWRGLKKSNFLHKKTLHLELTQETLISTSMPNNKRTYPLIRIHKEKNGFAHLILYMANFLLNSVSRTS